MIKFCIYFLLLSNVIYGDESVKETRELKLGGLRDVKATYQEKDKKLRIQVSFIPVKSFISSKNRELNQRKAKVYCLHAIMLWAGNGNNLSSLEISGLRVLESESNSDNRYFRTFELPLANIKIKSNTQASLAIKRPQPSTTKNHLEFSSKVGLLNRFDDYLVLVNEIECNFHCVIVIKNGFSDAESLTLFIADAEEEIITVLSRCKFEIQSDNLLLDAEKSDLLKVIEQGRGKLLSQLKAIYLKETNTIKVGIQ